MCQPYIFLYCIIEGLMGMNFYEKYAEKGKWNSNRMLWQLIFLKISLRRGAPSAAQIVAEELETMSFQQQQQQHCVFQKKTMWDKHALCINALVLNIHSINSVGTCRHLLYPRMASAQSILNCKTFDFFDIKFDYSSCSKFCVKYHFFRRGLVY